MTEERMEEKNGAAVPSGIAAIAEREEAEAAAQKKRTKKRIWIAVAVFGALFVIAVIVLLVALKKDTGWREVTVKTGESLKYGAPFTFWFQMDRSLAGADFRALSEVYDEAVVRAGEIFDPYEAHGEINGVYAVNHAVNLKIKVEPELYESFSLLKERNARWIYLAPLYEEYDNLLYAGDDALAEQHDPLSGGEARAFYEKAAAFARDPGSVDVELLGDCEVRLFVSEEYAAFAKAYGVGNYVDFYWMTNAFILDVVTEAVQKSGYTKGYITSADGFVSCLDDTGEEYGMILTSRNGNVLETPAEFLYQGPMRIVALHDYVPTDEEDDYFYVYRDGSFAAPYFDPADGLYKGSTTDLLLYSSEKGCAELILSAAELFIADVFSEDNAAEAAKKGTYPVYRNGNDIICYGNGATLRILQEGIREVRK